MNVFKRVSWSPYVVGALIGVLSWFTFASVDRPLGITTAFEYTAALAVQSAAPAIEASHAWFAEPDKDPKIDWEWMLVVGVFLGAWLSARLSGDRPERPQVPALWAERFGDGKGRRYAAAFVGGMLLMLGARFAQGCTSGHGISGTLQLAVSSFIFVAVFAAASIAAASAIYRHGGDHV
ncbi:YeeE/YedE thiosulfate transporter family protein [Piscinibacter sakaiensis]|uniref:YeeE/YedE thiosulfate transporter family protein n=1 Tax=Piscinibacter sakaiensis TaxID=1547922 RepID=UPI003AABEE1F